MRRHLVTRIVSLVLALAISLAGWLALAPRQLGGRASYAVIVGDSMEPRLHRGDLVVLHEAGDYRVGDVVAYRSSTIHRTVLHRIVGIHGGRYVIKGDHNSFLDPERPATGQIVGKKWVRVPFAGSVLERVRTPGAAALLASILCLFFGVAILTGRSDGVGEPRNV